MLALIGYGIYYLISAFPLESVLVLGILAILVIGYWIVCASKKAE